MRQIFSHMGMNIAEVPQPGKAASVLTQTGMLSQVNERHLKQVD